jgi:glycosyltransferase EpsH
MISVITPVHNEERYLSQCLDSILNQTYRDLEVIVVDNGSTDGSWEIIQNYAAQDQRIKAVHQEDRGPSGGRNRGLELMTGDYFTCIDADDWVEVDCFEQAYQAALANNADIVIWGFYRFNEEGILPQKTLCPKPGLYVEDECRQLWLDSIHRAGRQIECSMWLRLVRASMVKEHKLRFDPSVYYGEDYLFCCMIHYYAARVYCMNDRMYYHYRLNDHSMMHGYDPDRLHITFCNLHKIREFSKAVSAYNQEVQTRLDRACLYITTKIVKFERTHDVSKEEKIKIIDGILENPRVRDAIKQVGDETGKQLLGERYVYMRDKRSWELLNADHL